MAAFITCEGGEGAGKSTQISWLLDSMQSAGLKAISTREPGGSQGAERIRELLVTGDGESWLPETEAMLMMAARAEHVARAIRPALEAGKWVLCDRYMDSTLVYQGAARGLGDDWLRMLYCSLFGNFQPQLTIFLDIDPQLGLARTQQRSGNETRFESLPIAFHQQVRKGFFALQSQEPERIITVDASQKATQVHRAILNVINARFNLSLVPSAAAQEKVA